LIHDQPNVYDNGGAGIYHLSAANFYAYGLIGTVDWWGTVNLR